jgi:NUDIX domain-containing protein
MALERFPQQRQRAGVACGRGQVATYGQARENGALTWSTARLVHAGGGRRGSAAGAGDWLGASCVARYRDEGFVFAGAVRDDVLELSGIGGKVEPGERFRDAALREFEEETGTRPEVLVGVERPRHLGVEDREVPVPEGCFTTAEQA